MKPSSHESCAAHKKNFSTDSKRLKRRFITIPSLIIVTILLTLLMPVIIAVSFVVDLFRRYSFSTIRTCISIWLFLWLELIFLFISGWVWIKYKFTSSQKEKDYALTNRKIQKNFCKIYIPFVLKIFRAKINFHGKEHLESCKPSVMFTRHVSLIDTFIPVFSLYSLSKNKWPRYVLKAELLNDPLFDVVGNRFPNVFIRRGKGLSETETTRILNLRNTMEENETLVIFPEGTRFTPKKRKKLIKHSQKNGKKDLFKYASSLKATLPPLTKGSMALLSESVKYDLVVLAHRGFENVVTIWDLFKGSLIDKTIDIMITKYSFEEIPKDEDEKKLFLMNIWKKVDNYALNKS